jgi:vitamin B12 transporter
VAYGRIDDKGALDINNDYWNNTLSARFDLYPKDNWEITLTGRLNDSRYEYPTGDNGDKYDPLDPDQYERETDTVVGLTTKVQTTSWWENVFSVGYHRNETKNIDPENPGKEPPWYTPGDYQAEETRSSFDYHANLRYTSQDALQSILTLGYEYEREIYNREITGPDGSIISADRDNNAFYVQEQLSLFQRIHLVGGFRVEDNSQFGTEVSPRGSMAVDIQETGTKLRAAIGKGIKEPTFLENYYPLSGNPDLEPEKAISWEVGLDQKIWDERAVVSLTYFKNKYKDLIAFGYPNINVQESQSQGVEFSGRIRFFDGLAIGASYTFLDTEVIDDGGNPSAVFEKGKDLLRRPSHTASGWIDWRWGALRTFVKGLYVGEREDVDWRMAERVELDDYFVLDAAVSYQVPAPAPVKDMEVFVKGSNLLDEDYEEVFGFTAPGASFMAGLSFKL